MQHVKLVIVSMVALVALLVCALSVDQLFDRNEVGYVCVVESPTGSIKLVTQPGLFWQGFGKITRFRTANDTFAFSKDGKEGDGGDTSIPVRFKDGGQAKVTMDVTFKLPDDPETLRLIHRDWHTYNTLMQGLIKPQVNNVVQLTATKLSAEDSYTRKDLFINQVLDQLVAGSYEYRQIVKGEGVDFVLLTESGKDGTAVVKRQPSPFAAYKIAITKVTVRDVVYEKAIEDTLQAKQMAIQAQVTSRANAEKARMEALEAKASGDKLVAESVATERAKTEAARQELERARLESQATRVRAEAEAAQKRLLASANNSLDARLQVWLEANKAWANATTAPPVVFAATTGNANAKGGNSQDVLYSMMMMRMMSDQLKLDVVPKKVATSTP